MNIFTLFWTMIYTHKQTQEHAGTYWYLILRKHHKIHKYICKLRKDVSLLINTYLSRKLFLWEGYDITNICYYRYLPTFKRLGFGITLEGAFGCMFFSFWVLHQSPCRPFFLTRELLPLYLTFLGYMACQMKENVVNADFFFLFWISNRKLY